MPPPRPPSRIEPLTFPVFAISWFVDPGSGRSIVAYCGGGGSARTGVHNNIVLQVDDCDPPVKISTGDQVGVALHVYANPVTHRVWLVVALGNQVHRYPLSSVPPTEFSQLQPDMLEVFDDPSAGPDSMKKDGCNALAVSAMADRLAVGCESGLVHVYAMADESTVMSPEQEAEMEGLAFTTNPQPVPLLTLQGHEKAVCAMAFSMRGGKLVTSAKDGTACVWRHEDGSLIDKIVCEVDEPNGPKQQRRPPAQVLVRGCAFGDLDGRLFYTVASARRGKAFLYLWDRQPRRGPTEEQQPNDFQQGSEFVCVLRTECSPCPISAMSLSQDAGLLALGSVDGSIILWSTADWKPLKIYNQVHELPVTCIAARPFPVPLKGEEDEGVAIHARSASADSKLACLSLQKHAPKRQHPISSGGGHGAGIMVTLHRTFVFVFALCLLSPVVHEARDKCHDVWRMGGLSPFGRCLVEDVIIAPPWKPGITVPPY